MSLRPTTATLTACSERSGAWKRLFGSFTVVIKSPIPTRAELPGLGARDVYLVDLDRLSAAQLERIAQEMSVRFRLSVSVENLRSEGLPILADDVTVSLDARMVL